MERLTNAAGLNRARTVQNAGLVGDTALYQPRWVRETARTHTERVLNGHVEKAVTALKSRSDVEHSSTAVGTVICWSALQGEGHGL